MRKPYYCLFCEEPRSAIDDPPIEHPPTGELVCPDCAYLVDDSLEVA